MDKIIETKPIVWVPIYEIIEEPEVEIPVKEILIKNCSAKIISISNLGIMTLEFIDEFLYFNKTNLNLTNTDIYVISFQSLLGNSSINLNLTWELIEFSTDHRRMVFQLKF
jgi:hypothetical protein